MSSSAETNTKPVIVIGAPCYGTVAPDILEDWMRFAFHLGRTMPEYFFHIAIITKSEQFRARNTMVKAALQHNAAYLLMLDDDMVIDINQTLDTRNDAAGYDFLKKLIAHDKDICGVLYYQRTGGCRPVLMTKQGEGYRFLRDDEITGGLQEVDVAGGGCLLIKARVFDKITYPYFEPEFKWGTDIQLCQKAKAHGFSVFADTSIHLGHVREERVVVTARNRHQFAAEMVPGEVKQFITTEVFESLIQDAEEWTGFDRSEFAHEGQYFHRYIGKEDNPEADAEMYGRFPKERVARQIWFNTETQHKRSMTEAILTMVNHIEPRDILDFGCGVGIPAFFFAEKGHRVTARDLEGTGTYQFLQWRAKKHGLSINFSPVGGEVLADASQDIIVAMDVLEHMPDWREKLADLVRMLRPGGYLFCNNAILDDDNHPEHYPLKPKEFLAEAVQVGLRPIHQFLYQKAE